MPACAGSFGLEAERPVLLDLAPDTTCWSAAVVLGAVAPTPHRAIEAEKALLGKRIDEDPAREAAARLCRANAIPLQGNGDKVPLFETLVRRAVIGALATRNRGAIGPGESLSSPLLIGKRNSETCTRSMVQFPR